MFHTDGQSDLTSQRAPQNSLDQFLQSRPDLITHEIMRHKDVTTLPKIYTSIPAEQLKALRPTGHKWVWTLLSRSPSMILILQSMIRRTKLKTNKHQVLL